MERQREQFEGRTSQDEERNVRDDHEINVINEEEIEKALKKIKLGKALRNDNNTREINMLTELMNDIMKN